MLWLFTNRLVIFSLTCLLCGTDRAWDHRTKLIMFAEPTGPDGSCLKQRVFCCRLRIQEVPTQMLSTPGYQSPKSSSASCRLPTPVCHVSVLASFLASLLASFLAAFLLLRSLFHRVLCIRASSGISLGCMQLYLSLESKVRLEFPLRPTDSLSLLVAPLRLFHVAS